MNLSIYGFGDGPRRKWLIVDCGVSFAAESICPASISSCRTSAF